MAKSRRRVLSGMIVLGLCIRVVTPLVVFSCLLSFAPPPVLAQGADPDPAIAAGYDYSFGMRTDGMLWAWGYNGFGQLGLGDTTNRTGPTQVGASANWIAISAGDGHSLGIQSDGTLWSWGHNYFGELGLGGTATRESPTQVGTSTNWSAIAAGRDQSLALTSDGTLWAWGRNTYYVLGLGDTEHRYNPTQVGTSTNWSAIAAGHYHSLGIQSDGTLWAWGYGPYGKLGLGDTEHRSSPTQVGSSTDWTTIAAGVHHSLALKSDGTLWTWGYNGHGELGLGDTTNRSSPTQVGTATNWIDIAAGGWHSLALKSDGTLWTWGWNYNGQLGLGDNTDRNSPTQVGASTNWTDIAAGYGHSLALRSDGTLWAWGSNSYGELGLGDTTDRNSPAQTSFSVIPTQSVTIDNTSDGINALDNSALNGTQHLMDADITVNMTLGTTPTAAPTLYYDDDATPLDGVTTTASGSGIFWSAAISVSDANIYDGAAIRFCVDVDGTKYYRTGTTSWSYIVDGAAPTNVGCSTPANNGTNISTSTNLVALTAADAGSGLRATPYYFQLATNTAFTQNIQNSGWQSGTSWSPSLSAGTTYYWRVKARDNVGNESDNMGHTADTSGYGKFTTAATPVNTPPAASFTYSPSSSTTDNTVQFTDQSTDSDGTIAFWSWNFGDGTTSTFQHPTRQYSTAGTYTVTLTVTDNGGASDNISQIIIVSVPPVPGQTSTILSISPSSFTLQSGSSTTLTATLEDENSNSLMSKTISWSATSGSISFSSSATDSNGQVAVTYTAPSVTAQRSVTVVASFAGDNQYQASSNTSSGTITAHAPSPTILSIFPSSFIIGSWENKTQTLTASLTSGGSPLAGKSLSIYCSAGDYGYTAPLATDSSGQFQFYFITPTVSTPTGVTITVSFTGDNQYAASSDSLFGTVNPPGSTSTELSVSPLSFSIYSGQTQSLTATLTSGGIPLVGEALSIDFHDGGISYQSLATDSSGQVQFSYGPPGISAAIAVTISVSFAGDNQYASSSDDSSGTVSPFQTTVTFQKPDGTPLANTTIYWGTASDEATGYLGTTDSQGKITSTDGDLADKTVYFRSSDGAYTGSAYVSSAVDEITAELTGEAAGGVTSSPIGWIVVVAVLVPLTLYGSLKLYRRRLRLQKIKAWKKRRRNAKIDAGVYEYAVKHHGEMDARECAKRLNLTEEEVMQSVHRLQKAKRVKIEKVE